MMMKTEIQMIKEVHVLVLQDMSDNSSSIMKVCVNLGDAVFEGSILAEYHNLYMDSLREWHSGKWKLYIQTNPLV
jgi:hypothetical protein